MRHTFKSALLAGSAAMALSLAAATAGADGHNVGMSITNYDDAVAATSLAEDWIDGKLANPNVTYDGPVIT